MTQNQLEALLYRCESDVLDLKREAYQLAAGDDIGQSEFIKDVLAFANAWRTEDAHIVVGAEEMSGSRAKVPGVNAHPNDSTLQQIVNSKTDAPVRFIYEVIEFEGKKVGVVTIPHQIRPRFLRRDFGRLSANTVYVRRGSSTAVADPAEVSRMALHDSGQRKDASLGLEILDHQSGSVLTVLHFEPTLVDFGDISSMPDYPLERDPTAPAFFYSSMNTNSAYYRDIAQWVRDSLAYARLRFRVINKSEFVLRDVRVKFRVPINERINVAEISDLQLRPEKDTLSMFIPVAEKIKREVEWTVLKRIDELEVSCDIGKIQPGDDKTTEDPICLTASEQFGPLSVKFLIFSDDLPTPLSAERTFSFNPKKINRTLADVRAWASGDKRPPD